MLIRDKRAFFVYSYIVVSVVVLHWYIFSEFTITVKQEAPGYLLQPCNCLKHRKVSESSRQNVESTCSEEASWYGPHQKVISFSLYVPEYDFPNPDKPSSKPKPFSYFIEGLRHNLRQIHKFYPDWVVRVYTNVTLNEFTCQWACLDVLFWCDIRESKIPFLNITNPRVWRFLPFGDESVDIFLSRDIESYMILREKEAVSEWEFLSEKPFHLMRDFMYLRPVLAGQFGVKNNIIGWNTAMELRSNILEAARRSENRLMVNADEFILWANLYNDHKAEFLQHDSYTCEHWTGTRPFPRQRPSRWIRVGISIRDVGRIRLERPCPVACRPLKGQNWTYC